MKRIVGLLATLTVALSLAAPAPASTHAFASGSPTSLDFYPTRTRWAGRPHTTSPLTYNGGAVEPAPAVYISWWGPEWATGFSTGGYTSTQAISYTTDFFNNVGGSSWENITSQYCKGVATRTVTCGSSGQHIQNLTGQLKGTWNDTTVVPASPTQSDIAKAATRLMQHFGYSANATYF